jgi:hypothetical protein
LEIFILFVCLFIALGCFGFDWLTRNSLSDSSALGPAAYDVGDPGEGVGALKTAAQADGSTVLRNVSISFNHHNNDIITGINVAHCAGDGQTCLVG